jgi:hypothetical protein
MRFAKYFRENNMADDPTKFIDRLFKSEELNPVLKASYQAELKNVLEPQLTTRRALPGVALLVILLGCIAGIVRNLFVYEANLLVLASWLVMGGTFAWVAYLIVRDLLRRRHSPASAHAISQALFGAAGLITAATLLAGLSDPGNPASTFHTLFVFVFYFTCAAWVTANRIAAAELAAREQMLRIEYRLAALAERLSK